MFFLMRYQIVIATRREINFARQFSSVSLVHRTETNIARQFFEVCPFIMLCSKILRAESNHTLPSRCAGTEKNLSEWRLRVVPQPALARSNASGSFPPLAVAAG
jgi:hypothetical protein